MCEYAVHSHRLSPTRKRRDGPAISLVCQTALLNEDVTPFLTQWLQSLRVDQRENGSIPFTVPDVSIYYYAGIRWGKQTGCGGPVCSAGWGDAAVTVPMVMYEVTGNIRILKSSMTA